MPAAIESIEIYPNIRVYKNMFKDISKSYQILTDSLLESEDRLFSPWTQWSIFGTYLNPMFPNFFIPLFFLTHLIIAPVKSFVLLPIIILPLFFFIISFAPQFLLEIISIALDIASIGTTPQPSNLDGNNSTSLHK